MSFGKFLIKCNDHEAHLDGVIYGDKKVTDSYPIPTYEQVFAWFRKKGLFHSITLVKDFFEDSIFFESEIRNSNADIITMFTSNTYEEAKIELLKRLIEFHERNV